MNRTVHNIWVVVTIPAALMGLVLGCNRPDPNLPPTIRLGASVCVDCDMIISDARFASATMVKDDRGGTKPLLYDDIGDQIRYETFHPALTIRARWVHDHDTKNWLRAEDAWYVRSDDLHTPMASGIAAFATRESAAALTEKVGGDVLDFKTLWERVAQEEMEP